MLIYEIRETCGHCGHKHDRYTTSDTTLRDLFFTCNKCESETTLAISRNFLYPPERP